MPRQRTGVGRQKFTAHLNITWKDKVSKEVVREKTGQAMLQTTGRKRRLQCMEDCRIAKQALHWVHVEIKKTEVDHASPGKTSS